MIVQEGWENYESEMERDGGREGGGGGPGGEREREYYFDFSLMIMQHGEME